MVEGGRAVVYNHACFGADKLENISFALVEGIKVDCVVLYVNNCFDFW